MGGLLSGLDRVTAASFSFYLSIPVLLLAGSYQLLKGVDELDTVSGGAPALVAGKQQYRDTKVKRERSGCDAV